MQIVPAYLRYYPHHELAAHVLGYVSEISAAQVKALHKQGYRGGDTIGQAGIESYYDKYLRGTRGRVAAARRLARAGRSARSCRSRRASR